MLSKLGSKSVSSSVKLGLRSANSYSKKVNKPKAEAIEDPMELYEEGQSDVAAEFAEEASVPQNTRFDFNDYSLYEDIIRPSQSVKSLAINTNFINDYDK